jgi:hypothetical protein
MNQDLIAHNNVNLWNLYAYLYKKYYSGEYRVNKHDIVKDLIITDEELNLIKDPLLSLMLIDEQIYVSDTFKDNINIDLSIALGYGELSLGVTDFSRRCFNKFHIELLGEHMAIGD